MTSTNSLSRQLPQFITEDPYISALLYSKSQEFVSLDDFREDLEKQFFIDTATWGLILWERALNLPTNTSLDNIIVVEEYNPALRLHGNWTNVDLTTHPDFAAIRGTSNAVSAVCDASDPSNWLEHTFWGTGIRLYRSAINNEKCNCVIKIDNTTYPMLVNESTVNPCANEILFEKQGLNWGAHTIKITFSPNKGNFFSKFVIDRLEVTNNLAQGYDKRRAVIRAKMMPIRKVTRKTLIDLAANYGFYNITLDESIPYTLKVDFDYNANADYEIRKKLITDFKMLIPAHIELYNKFMVSTFYDIEKIHLTWDEMKETYRFYDFLDAGISDPLDSFYTLNKYYDLTIFNYRHFNSDTEMIDSLIMRYYYDNLHYSNRVSHKNLNYNMAHVGLNAFGTITTAAQISLYCTELARMLLSNDERHKMARLATNQEYDGIHIGYNFRGVIETYQNGREKLRTAINNHPYLKAKGTNVVANGLTALMAPTTTLATTSTFDPTSITSPLQVAEGKVAFDGTNFITGSRSTIDIETMYTQLPLQEDGVALVVDELCYIGKDFYMEPQEDLVPESIRTGVTIFGVPGNCNGNYCKYNKDDYIFPWQYKYQTGFASTHFKFKY